MGRMTQVPRSTTIGSGARWPTPAVARLVALVLRALQGLLQLLHLLLGLGGGLLPARQQTAGSGLNICSNQDAASNSKYATLRNCRFPTAPLDPGPLLPLHVLLPRLLLRLQLCDPGGYS